MLIIARLISATIYSVNSLFIESVKFNCQEKHEFLNNTEKQLVRQRRTQTEDHCYLFSFLPEYMKTTRVWQRTNSVLLYNKTIYTTLLFFYDSCPFRTYCSHSFLFLVLTKFYRFNIVCKPLDNSLFHSTALVQPS